MSRVPRPVEEGPGTETTCAVTGPLAEVEEVEPSPEPTGLDDGEFHEAFRVFSNHENQLSTATSVLVPFLKSLGLRDRTLDAVVKDVREANSHGLIAEGSLRGIAARHVASLEKEWPQDRDVLQAFRVFDSEGVGFIKVTLLKRFLVQAQLDVEDGVLERLIRDNCQIDGDDLINYNDFVSNISEKFVAATTPGRHT